MLEPALGDEVADVLGQCMYSLAGLLPNAGEQLMPVSQKCSSGLTVVLMPPRVAQGVFMISSVVVPMSIKVWRASLSLPSNMSLSCFQLLQWLSACSVSMSKASR